MAVGTQLFGRDLVLTVGTVLITTRDPKSKDARPMLHTQFKITKSLTSEPNTAEITIYNLNAEHRAALQQRHIPFSIAAGYVGNTHQIFSGQLTYGHSSLMGSDWVTTVQSGDGALATKSSRINTSLQGPVGLTQALQTAAAAMGLGPGNLSQAASQAPRATMTQFLSGLVMSGKADVQLDKITKAAGLTWSIQDGQLAFLSPTSFLGPQIITLEAGTGLVGSPEQGDRGYIKARALLQPDLLPGYRVQIVSRIVNGVFRIEKTTFTGDTSGGDWYVELEAKPL